MSIDAGDAIAAAGQIVGATNPVVGLAVGLLGGLFSKHRATVPAPTPNQESGLPPEYHADLVQHAQVLDGLLGGYAQTVQALMAQLAISRATSAGVPLSNQKLTADSALASENAALRDTVASLQRAILLAAKARQAFPEAAKQVDAAHSEGD